MTTDPFDDDIPTPTAKLFKTNTRPVNSELIEEARIPLVSDTILSRFDDIAEQVGGEFTEPELYKDSVARTMFDTPQSKDDTLTLVLPSANIGQLPTQALVRIKSTDGRNYLGVIVEGPFAEPDGLRGDSPIIVTVTVAGSILMPKYHGRVHVALLGEETEDGLTPPRFRPLPNSPAFPLSDEDTSLILNISPTPEESPLRLGLAVGHENLPVAIPAHVKGVLPRHVAVLGTTGGGKSTTVSGMIGKLQKANLAVTLIDTEGEYTQMNEQTSDLKMQSLLKKRGLKAEGVKKTVLYHLVGKDTSNPEHPNRRQFCLRFARLSPHLIKEILDMTPAQEERFLEAHDATRKIMAELKIFPSESNYATEVKQAFDWDEMEEGYPKMRLDHIWDVVRLCGIIAKKEPTDDFQFTAPDFATQAGTALGKVTKIKGSFSGDSRSWWALQGKLGSLKRLNIFEVFNGVIKPLNFREMTTPGQVSIIDLSGTDSPQINNLVIAELLRGILEQQDENFKRFEKNEGELVRAMVVIEEAHEFLSRERIKQMPVLFQQVARIARRGRKRWLGLTFVTQLPQHLPDEVLGLVNNFILHKISDSGVIERLKHSIGGIDPSLWTRLPNLAPGQAIVSMTSMTRPLLTAIDPTPCFLRMVE